VTSPRPRGRVALAAVALGAALCLVPTRAHGSPRYPDELRAVLALSYVPTCGLCHGDVADAADAAVGPANTPFAASMIARGLRAETPIGDAGSDAGPDAAVDAAFDADSGAIDPSLVAAIEAMRRDGVDSDGDGAQDLDELSWGGDPNHYDGIPPDQVKPATYGCSQAASDAGSGRASAHGVPVAFAILAAGALARSVRTARRRS
jgi:hypothetical protein